MLKNYLLTAWRNLRKQKMYTVINVTGLSVGIGCAVLVYAFMRSEWTYDQFHPRYETISRIGVGINF
jgi:putative ABC transport system permease protein|tara:strand:- start:16 stop:216 length:201 start_codon:yes stop_codon:yes gene_type:complete